MQVQGASHGDMHFELVVAFGAQPASDILKIVASLQGMTSDVFRVNMRLGCYKVSALMTRILEERAADMLGCQSFYAVSA